MQAEPTLSAFREAHRQRITTQLPALGYVVTAGGLAWFALTALAGPIPVLLVFQIVVFQSVTFAAAAFLVRRKFAVGLETVVAVVACVAVGSVWVLLLTFTANVAAMLMFATLMLFGAAPVVLAWGLGPQLVFQASVTAVWAATFSLVPRQLPILDLVAAIGFGNGFSFVAAWWAARTFRAEVALRLTAAELERQIAASRDAYRALAENAVDFIWAVDLQGRWTYVNDALARRCGLTPHAMIGRPVSEILAAGDGNPDPEALIRGVAMGEPLAPRTLEMTTPDGPCWVEAVPTAVRAPDGSLVGVQGVSRDVTARRVAEERLRSSEERFRSVFTNAPIGMAIVAPGGEIQEVNRSLSRMFGYEEHELIGSRGWDLVHPDDAPAAQALVDATLAGERPGFSLEFRHLHRDGHVVWNQVHSFLERDPDGYPRRLITQVADVTEQRAAESALRESEHRFRTFAESMAAGVLIAQARGIVYANDAVSAITGFSREDILGMQVWDLVHADERAVARERVAARLRGERWSPRIEYRLATKSGEPRWVDITITVIELDGAPAMLGTAFDVTERRLAEQRLRASEERYRSLVETQCELVTRFDTDGRVTFANDAYCDAYGIRSDEVVGSSFWQVVYPDDVETLRAAAVATTLPPYRGHAEIRTRTVKGWRWFEWDGGAIRDAQGTVVEFQGAGRDVTERRRTQDALRASLEQLRRSEERLRLLAQRQVAVREEERKRLSLDLHDDVCQELVGTSFLVESVIGRLESAPSDAVADLARVKSYLGVVVAHLRVLARDLRPLLLNELGLEGSLRSLVAGFSRGGDMDVQVNFLTAIPRLDETLELTVYRIAQEAVTNAVRHSEARTVVVDLGVGDGCVHLEVRDDGLGFEVGRAARSFGLASMEERAEALGGGLALDSRAGVGTTVRLDCPMVLRSSATTAA